MNRSISLILFMAFIMLSGPVVLPANAGPSIHQTGGHILIADNTKGTSTAGEAAPTPAAGQTTRPNIMIPDPLFNFETVVDGTEVVHDFRVYNRGTGELAIEKVQTG
jgi:hypothetical protein